MDNRICLIVDHEPALRTYISMLLQRQGIRTLEAGSAVEALRILHGRGEEIGLLITDIKMPGDLDGLDLAYSARNLFSSLRVILISGGLEDAPQGFVLVRKPFLGEAIMKAVDQANVQTGAGGAR